MYKTAQMYKIPSDFCEKSEERGGGRSVPLTREERRDRDPAARVA